MLLAVKISLAFVILLVGLTLFLSERRVAAANAKYPPLGEIVDINGKSIHALVMGEGPDLVLIHGASGNMRDFTLSIAPELAKSYRVFLFDRPGWVTQRRSIDRVKASKSKRFFCAKRLWQWELSARLFWGKAMGARSLWLGPFMRPKMSVFLSWLPQYSSVGDATASLL